MEAAKKVLADALPYQSQEREVPESSIHALGRRGSTRLGQAQRLQTVACGLHLRRSAKRPQRGRFPGRIAETGPRCARRHQRAAKGIDPSAAKKAAKLARNNPETFEAVALEWYQKKQASWSQSYKTLLLQRLEKDVFPYLGGSPVSEIEPPEILAVIRRIESRGAIETAHKAVQNVGAVMRYAVATGRATRDPAADLKGALETVATKHLAALTDARDIASLLRAIDGYGNFVTRSALQLIALTFVRPRELRQAEWSEIDLDRAVWRIPERRMKRRIEHVVPLSRQAVGVLSALKPLTDNSRFIFPNTRTRKRCMSEATLTAALRRMGYSKDEMTAHGFRTVASTTLNEMGWNRDAIERQLAHLEGNRIRAAYHRTDYLPERTRMMQAWADHLDALRDGTDVIPIHRNRMRGH